MRALCQTFEIVRKKIFLYTNTIDYLVTNKLAAKASIIHRPNIITLGGGEQLQWKKGLAAFKTWWFYGRPRLVVDIWRIETRDGPMADYDSWWWHYRGMAAKLRASTPKASPLTTSEEERSILDPGYRPIDFLNLDNPLESLDYKVTSSILDLGYHPIDFLDLGHLKRR
ncbi:hypothetical protein ACFE04_031021 [Oxalis oulophora]